MKTFGDWRDKMDGSCSHRLLSPLDTNSNLTASLTFPHQTDNTPPSVTGEQKISMGSAQHITIRRLRSAFHLTRWINKEPPLRRNLNFDRSSNHDITLGGGAF